MTAEIAVLNKEAVALAADSAVTISTTNGPKIFNSVSKIFGMSKRHPVGVMIYGGASLLGVPWETIIKSFRDSLGTTQHGQLEDYSSDLIRFLEADRGLFPQDAQRSWVAATVKSYFRFIERRILAAVRDEIEAKGQLTHAQVQALVSDEIREHHDDWKAAKDLPASLGGRADAVRRSYARPISDVRRTVFGKAPVSRAASRQLGEIGRWLFTKQAPEGRKHPGRSGLVVAGFGVDDVFPKLRRFEVDGMALDTLVYLEGEPVDVDRANGAGIAPFAQREMVTTFIEGMHPNLEAALNAEFHALARDHPDAVIDASDLSDVEKKKLKSLFRAETRKRVNSARRSMRAHTIRDHIMPILDVVEVLPKDELAAMAESLVNLTSFRRRVTFAAETVGGPIDVAVISKGDGFIWINRKHYFKRELNPQFYANRYGGPNGA
jgi:hypothetical protein